MHKYLFALGVVVLPVFTAAAPCSSFSTAQEYQDLGATGCTAGVFTIKNLSWTFDLGTTPENDQLVEVPASQVFLTPIVSATNVGLAFSSDLFNLDGFEAINARLRYTIDPPPPILDDFSLSMDANSPVAPGFAIINADICAGSPLGPTGDPASECNRGTRLNLQVFHLGGSNTLLLDSVEFPQPVNFVDVLLALDMRAKGATSQIGGGAAVSNLVPEPGAGLLAALGLAAIAGIRRIRNS
jgi:hypothetical protein